MPLPKVVQQRLIQEVRFAAEKMNCRIFEKPFEPDEILFWLKNECEKNLSPDRVLIELAEPVLA